MQSNEEIASILKWYADLGELHGLNSFKVKSFQSAAFRIDKMPEPLFSLSPPQWAQLPNIGKSIAEKLLEIKETGSFSELTELISTTPPGVIELFKVKGIGPKKIAYIWNVLGIESLGELLYACNENRLSQAKGFGVKTQQSIKESILFLQEHEHFFHYAKVAHWVDKLVEDSKGILKSEYVSACGQVRRKCEVVDKIELIVAASDCSFLETLDYISDIVYTDKGIEARVGGYIPLVCYTTTPNSYFLDLFLHTANDAHLALLDLKQLQGTFTSEQEIYEKLGMAYIEPEMREGTKEVLLATQRALPVLITYSQLKGVLHNHTTYSDGANTLEEMALHAMHKGYQYLGVCDHSQSAQYAGGLKPEKVRIQHQEIDALNKRLAPFKIFKGIESDILADGSLDYEPDMLDQFDFIVASIHSNLKMTQDKAMSRLLKAIENPYTTLLGHPTGRLLLMREGYPVDHRKLIDACAANGVAIEINANPYRLDLDWRWISYAMEKDVMLAINPDAHERAGYDDMYYGVCVARKGGLTANYCLNTQSCTEIEAYFKRKHSK